MTMQVDKARLDEMLAGLSEKVRAEIMRSASILRPAELATAVDSTIEIHVRQSLRSLRSTEGKDGEPVATMHKSATETLFSKGSVPNLMGFTSQPLYTTPEAAEAQVAKLIHPFRNVDESDWHHLFAVLPETSRGKFWKAVFTEARAALTRSPE